MAKHQRANISTKLLVSWISHLLPDHPKLLVSLMWCCGQAWQGRARVEKPLLCPQPGSRGTEQSCSSCPCPSAAVPAPRAAVPAPELLSLPPVLLSLSQPQTCFLQHLQRCHFPLQGLPFPPAHKSVVPVKPWVSQCASSPTGVSLPCSHGPLLAPGLEEGLAKPP